MISSDFSSLRHLTGIVIGATKAGQRLVVLDALPMYPMTFDVRELLWL